MAGHEPTGAVEEIDAAWRKIESAISALGAVVRAETENGDALQRFEGYKTVLLTMAESYVNQVHYDRRRPEALTFLSPIFNYAGPSPDFIYKIIHLEPGASYRVWGRRGDAELIDFQQMIGWYGQRRATEKRSIVTLPNQLFDALGVNLDKHGHFDFVIGGDQREGQWVRLGDGVSTIIIREYFTDYASQSRPSRFYFDRLDDDGRGSTMLDVDESLFRLGAFAHALEDYTYTFQMLQFQAGVGENKHRELNWTSEAGAADQRYLQARFVIKQNQAAIGKWKLPETVLYWATCLYNDPYQMLNYGNRQVNLNRGLAKMSADGTLYFVISHQDPGIANWLDPDGHEEGLILSRTKGAVGPVSLPELKIVPADEIFQHLPNDVAKITREERIRNLAVRRRHFHLRESL